jgi:single-strand DNA-binding protein
MIIGSGGEDAEWWIDQGRKPVTACSVAVGRMYKTPEGESREETEWFRVVAWNQLAEICNQSLHKGSTVSVEGRLQTRTWKDNSGQDRYMTEVIANDMQMLDTRQAGQGPSEAPARGGQSFGGGGDDLDDEIPF